MQVNKNCEDCGEIINISDIIILDVGKLGINSVHKTLCRVCAEDKYFTCDNCGNTYHITQIYTDKLEGYEESRYCKECGEQIESTIDNLEKRINDLAKSDLEKAVAKIVLEECPSHDSNNIKNWFIELSNHGCVSGMICSLTNYKDTLKFFNDYKEDINKLLGEYFYSTGFNSPLELFNKKWDIRDPLALNTMNQNLLAWFGFEETARNLAIQLGYDM